MKNKGLDEAIAVKIMEWHKETLEDLEFNPNDTDDKLDMEYFSSWSWINKEGTRIASCEDVCIEDGWYAWSPSSNLNDMAQVEKKIDELGLYLDYIYERFDREGLLDQLSRYSCSSRIQKIDQHSAATRAECALKVFEASEKKSIR